jgi:hypothetical protein
MINLKTPKERNNQKNCSGCTGPGVSDHVTSNLQHTIRGTGQDEVADEAQWRQSVEQFRTGLDEAKALVQAQTTDFYGSNIHAPD